jgi:hypothetical protein
MKVTRPPGRDPAGNAISRITEKTTIRQPGQNPVGRQPTTARGRKAKRTGR